MPLPRRWGIDCEAFVAPMTPAATGRHYRLGVKDGYSASSISATIPESVSNGRNWPVGVRLPTGLPSLNVGLLGHLERVVNLDAEISDGTFQLRMTKQKLNSPQIFRTSVN
jgi:hypothetical protein